MASKNFNLIRNQSFLITSTNNSYFPAGNRDKVVCIYILLWDLCVCAGGVGGGVVGGEGLIIVYLINWTLERWQLLKNLKADLILVIKPMWKH